MSELPKELLYTKTHEWVKIEGTTIAVGITDYAQKLLGSIVYAEAFTDEHFERGEECGAIESIKAAGDIIAPVSGVVIAFNNHLVNHPEAINEDPYRNWILKMTVDDRNQLNDLLKSREYEEEYKNEKL